MAHEIDKREIEALNEVVKTAQEQFLQGQARQFADCAINLMATCTPMKDVAQYLRDQAELIEMYG